MKHAILLCAVLVAMLMPQATQAGGYVKTCRNIPHGRICYVNGHFYSLRCDHGYMVWPRGNGRSCVAVR